MSAMVSKALRIADDIREDGENAGQVSTTMAELFEPFVADWRKVGDADGVTLTYSPENLRNLFRVSGVFAATLRAFNACADGAPRARRKN
jgi:hypothetical protein